MRITLFAFSIFFLFTSLKAEKKVTQGSFFRKLGVMPTEQATKPFGGLKTIVKIYKAKALKETKLELEESNIHDLKPFAQLHHLEWLRLSHNPVSDLKPLAEMKNLQVLALYGLPAKNGVHSGINDLSPLSNLHELWSLSLDEHNITDLSPLSELINLRSLYLTHNRIVNTQPIKRVSEPSKFAPFHECD